MSNHRSVEDRKLWWMNSLPFVSKQWNGCSVEQLTGKRKQSIGQLSDFMISGQRSIPGASCPPLEIPGVRRSVGCLTMDVLNCCVTGRPLTEIRRKKREKCRQFKPLAQPYPRASTLQSIEMTTGLRDAGSQLGCEPWFQHEPWANRGLCPNSRLSHQPHPVSRN